MSSIIKKINSGRLARIGLYSSIATALLAAPITASAYSFKDSSGNVEFTVGGYAKLSAIYTDTDSGTIAGGASSLARNIYLPSATPVSASNSAESHDSLDFTARESRINFKAKTTQGDHKMGMVLEMDFLGTTNGNEVVSNSYSPRVRHFFFTFDNWLFGQTWSTFMDTGALAEAVDFLASPEGIVFIRQPQVRYTSGDFQIALENPESFISGSADRDVGVVPDIAANYKVKGDWGHMRLNGLVRLLAVDNAATAAGAASTTITPCTAAGVPDASCVDANDTFNAITPGAAATAAVDETETGFGIGLSGKIKVGTSDDIRFSANYGDGMGRYTSLGVVKDAVLIGDSIETVKSVAATVAYRHVWNAKSRSNLILSGVDIDNPTGASTAENKSASSVQINYLYSPVKQITYGIMYLAGEREIESGADGKLDRVQATAKYSF